MRIRNIRKAVLSLSLLMLTGGIVYAQVQRQPMPQQQQQASKDFKDETLQKFVVAQQEVKTIQQKRQQEMVKAIQGQDLDVQTFNKIAQSQQSQDKSSSQDVSQQDVQAFNAAAKEVQTIKKSMQQEMQTAIQESGMEVNQYKEVMFAYRQDKELQQKIDGMMSSN